MTIVTVKLTQYFGTWNGNGVAFTPRFASEGPLGLAAVYMSTMLYFHLLFSNTQSTTTTLAGLSTNDTASLLNDSSYRNQTGTLDVGDVAGQLPLAAIDIEGPNYIQGDRSYPAVSTLLPLLYANYDAQDQQAYAQSDQSVGILDANVTLDFSAVLYAVWLSDFW